MNINLMWRTLQQKGSGDSYLPVSDGTINNTIVDIAMNKAVASGVEMNSDIKVNIGEADCVGVVGTGNFGKAITNKLVKCGVQVVVGTRNPTGLFKSIEKALQENIVILAVPSFSWPDLPLTKIQAGTILIDCSNRTKTFASDEISQAEKHQEFFHQEFML
jgi:hypothetical protein